MAALIAKAEMKKGDSMIGRSIIDSRFDCKIVDEGSIGNKIRHYSFNLRKSPKSDKKIFFLSLKINRFKDCISI